MVSRRAVIVGSGPNGLTAAARLAVEGWDVEVYEASASLGGAASSTDDIFAGCTVDRGAACHPFGVASPAFRALGLECYGLEWAWAPYQVAHPLEGTEAALLSRSVGATAQLLGKDASAWCRLHRHVAESADAHLANLLAPVLRVPQHPAALLRFAPAAVLPASTLGQWAFSSPQARALLAGNAVHSISSPARPLTGAFGVLFGALGMSYGWPVARGGTQAISDALVRVIRAHGGRIHTGCLVEDVRELPGADALVLNLTLRQMRALKGLDIPQAATRRLGRWRYGTAAFKVDFLLKEPVPWRDARVGQAGTVHVGGTVEEMVHAEREAARGRLPRRPFVMVSQQYVADPTRGRVLWTYAHVPHGFVEAYQGQVWELIIDQIERFAPGFRDVIADWHEMSPAQLEAWNPNLVGGDIAGGAMTGLQALLRPGLALRPHRLGRGIYVASASTAPGAGVHGMAGWWAAQEVLRDTGEL
ncbi:phytoene desaturase family protein [Corynebacterium lizhenjunii]|uniref:phytoene desaturase family protein n=1 Tax=Corynebacterium lizhenjunii TaxID=2709394 RepID=UPI0013E9C46C|nr:NAD(P)/FAD-dependent oxidoreductase [Corynebacterium lizhenjunii]